MVDDITVAARTQPNAVSHVSFSRASKASASSSPAKQTLDSVSLSDYARHMLERLKDTKSVAEAWMDHQIDLAAQSAKTEKVSMADSAQAGNKNQANADGTDADPNAKADLKANVDQKVDQAVHATGIDIGWLVEAWGITPEPKSMIADVLSARAEADNVGYDPPLADVVVRAERSGGVAALKVEGLTLDVEDGRVVHADAQKVGLTTVHGSVAQQLNGADHPVVIHVGGASQSLGGVGDDGAQTSETPRARAEKTEDHGLDKTDSAKADAVRRDDAHHAVLIVRQARVEGGSNSLSLKLDAFLPLT